MVPVPESATAAVRSVAIARDRKVEDIVGRGEELLIILEAKRKNHNVKAFFKTVMSGCPLQKEVNE